MPSYPTLSSRRDLPHRFGPVLPLPPRHHCPAALDHPSTHPEEWPLGLPAPPQTRACSPMHVARCRPVSHHLPYTRMCPSMPRSWTACGQLLCSHHHRNPGSWVDCTRPQGLRRSRRNNGSSSRRQWLRQWSTRRSVRGSHGGRRRTVGVQDMGGVRGGKVRNPRSRLCHGGWWDRIPWMGRSSRQVWRTRFGLPNRM